MWTRGVPGGSSHGEPPSLILEALHDGFIIFDPAWRFTYANPSAGRLLGATPEQLLGRIFWEAFPVAKGLPLGLELHRAMRERLPMNTESFFPVPLNCWLEFRCHPWEEGLAVYVTDITKRKQMETVSQQDWRDLERAKSFFHIIVTELSLEGRWLKVPPLLCTYLGYAESELLSLRLQDCLHPADVKDDWHQFQMLMLSDLKVFSSTKRLRHKNGHEVWFDVGVTLVVDSQGVPERFLCHFRDVTENRLAEKRVRTQAELLNQVQDAIIIRSLEGEFAYWNQGAANLYGVKNAGQKQPILLYPETAPEFQACVIATLQTGCWSGDMEKRTEAGKAIIVHSRWLLLSNADSVPGSILVVDSDITEKVQVETQFHRAQRMECVGRLATGIAHDLNNIFTPILMAMPLLREQLPPDSPLPLIDTVESSVQRGADIVKQVITFVRGTVAEKTPLQLRNVIREMTKIARETFPKSIEVVARQAPDLWPVLGDATQLYQVLMNLCVNARDAMPGGGTLTIVAENCQLEGDLTGLIGTVNPGPHVVLTVADTGTGIAAELLSSIFDPFMTTKPVGQGTGIGLYTVREIVKHHCGTVQVASTPGQGTRFVLYLPAVLEANLAPQRPENQVLPCGHGELVLLVEDEATIREVSSLILQSHGYRVLGVSEGAEAITLYRERAREIDLVITDLAMPIMDGWALIRSLQQINPQVLIIALTGLEDVDLVELGTLGVRKVLTKPCSAEMMLTAMQSVLEKPVHPAPPAVGTTKRNHAAPASEFPACSPV
jgi:PAS domain S-box-containing protein